jgi:hypothetical protein
VRTIRAVALLARDRRLPWPLRVLIAVGALPIPGPVDEAVLLVAAAPLLVFYRPLLREAWRRAGETTGAAGAG